MHPTPRDGETGGKQHDRHSFCPLAHFTGRGRQSQTLWPWPCGCRCCKGLVHLSSIAHLDSPSHPSSGPAGWEQWIRVSMNRAQDTAAGDVQESIPQRFGGVRKVGRNRRDKEGSRLPKGIRMHSWPSRADAASDVWLTVWYQVGWPGCAGFGWGGGLEPLLGGL